MRLRAMAFWVLSAACATPALAEVRYGVDLGVNVSDFHYERDRGFPFDLWTDRHRKTLPTIAGVVEFQVRERLALTTGLRYVSHGIRVDIDDVFTTGFENTLHYLSAPVLLLVRPFPSRRLFVAAGPEIAVLLAASSEYKGSGLAEPFDIKDSLDPTNLSLDGQVGLEIPMGAQAGLASVRYCHGVAGVAKESRWASDWSTRGVEVLFGVRW